MTRLKMFVLTALVAVLLLIGCASAAQQVTLGSAEINGAGGTQTITMMLDQALTGLSGYTITLTIADPSVAQIQSWQGPSWASLWSNATFPASSGWVQAAAFTAAQVPDGSTNILLGTATIQGLSEGTTTITATLTYLDDNYGGNYIPTTTIVPGTISVYGTPSAAFIPAPSTGSAPLEVTFTDESTGGITSWDLNFGDSSPHATGTGPWTHTYTSADTYHATLTVNNPVGPESSVTHDIVVTLMPLPEAAFTVTATNGLAPVSVDFTDASTGAIDTYKWEYRLADDGAWTEFGGGAQSPSGVEFATPGTYDIRLTVSNAGGSDTETKTHVFSAAMAHDYLTTVVSGTVSGDLFTDSVSPFTTTATQTFTLPAGSAGNVQWARLYVNTYGGSAAGDYGHISTVSLDGTTIGTETCNVKSTTNNLAYPINDHVVKVYSDYEAVYDVTSLITTTTPTVTVTDTEISGLTLDGRIKGITLVVAYNDGDSDVVRFIVNHGNDRMSPAGATSSTAFDMSTFPSGWTSVSMKTLAFSSTDGTYTLNSGSITPTTLLSSSYIKYNQFDLTGALNAGTTNTLGYTAVGSSFKTTFAAVKARYVQPPTLVDFHADKTVGSTSDAISFTDDSVLPDTDEPATYAWTFGDGETSDQQNPTHTYTTEGLKTVSLTVTNEGGSVTETKADYINVVDAFIYLDPAEQTLLPGETTTYNIVLSKAPTGLAGFDLKISLASGSVADIIGVDYPAWAQMKDTSTLPADIVTISAIDMGNSVQPGAEDPVLATITVRGTQNGDSAITLGDLNMDDDFGDALNPTLTSGTVHVSSYGSIVAAFTGTPRTGNYPLDVTFDASGSSGIITTYQWDFGDGQTYETTSTAAFVHTYSAIGSYNVKLTVSGPSGSNTHLENAYIIVGDGVVPTALIVADPMTGNYPLTVGFSATTGGNVQTYDWNFGDGVHSYLPAPSHTYTMAGDFAVTLTVTGTGGSGTSNTLTIHITNDAPVANFIASPSSGTAPLFVQFYDQSTNVVYGTAGTTYLWEYNDGSGWIAFPSGSADQNPTMTFTSADTYTIRLTVTEGSESSTHEETIVTTGLSVDFTAPVTSGLASRNHTWTATFDGSASTAADTWAWDFGDSGTAAIEDPTHAYSGRLEKLTVTLTATHGSDVASRTKTDYINLEPYVEAFPKTYVGGLPTTYYTKIPTDLNGDYVYEDVNGNDRLDYDDVVAFYNAYIISNQWIKTNTDVDIENYDYTANGEITSNDVIALYDMVLYS